MEVASYTYAGPLWELVTSKEHNLFMLLASVADEVRQEVFGRQDNVAIQSITHCAACGKAPAVGSSLKRCNACHAVYYCNHACQKAHWKAHKKQCKKARAGEGKGLKTEEVLGDGLKTEAADLD